MSVLIEIVGYLNLVAFTALAAVAVRRGRSRHDRASLWAALTFGTLGIVVLAGQVLPDNPTGALEETLVRLVLAVLVVFPYCLYRFTTAFDPPTRRLETLVGGLTLALVAWTFALPSVPTSGEPRPAWFVAYLLAFVVHWTVLSVVAAVRLWRAGRGQPSVARRRMWMLAAASGAMTLAILLAAAGNSEDSPLSLATGLLAFTSAIAFLLGLAPPATVRLMWRRPEQRRVQLAISELMGAPTEEEVGKRVLPPMTDIVGARAAALLDSTGGVIAAHGLPDEVRHQLDEGRRPPLENGAAPLELATSFGSLLVWTTPYAPFFGQDELALLRTLGSLTGLALDRARLFAQERAARVALERADELKTNFIALAAHELRTPVASLYGLSDSLVRLGDRLSDRERDDVRQAIAGQATRLTILVEQLLDLSRLDADAVRIEPQCVAVHERLTDLLKQIPHEGVGVELDVAPALIALVDPHAFDRIVSNLVSNACRYGESPVRISAEQRDRHFRLTVEDRGPGVPPEFVADLFERFTRSEGSRARPGGTGLGLAIARSYARAHGGEVLYEATEPHGARFEVVLPRKA